MPHLFPEPRSRRKIHDAPSPEDLLGKPLSGLEKALYDYAIDTAHEVKTIAAIIGLSEASAKQHLHRVYAKQGGSRIELMHREIMRLRLLVEQRDV